MVIACQKFCKMASSTTLGTGPANNME